MPSESRQSDPLKLSSAPRCFVDMLEDEWNCIKDCFVGNIRFAHSWTWDEISCGFRPKIGIWIRPSNRWVNSCFGGLTWQKDCFTLFFSCGFFGLLLFLSLIQLWVTLCAWIWDFEEILVITWPKKKSRVLPYSSHTQQSWSRGANTSVLTCQSRMF